MDAKQGQFGVLLLIKVSIGFAMASQALAGEMAPKLSEATHSSSVHVLASATIIERPSISCDRVPRAVTAEITAFHPPADGHSHPVAIPQFNCRHLESMVNLTMASIPVEPAMRQLGTAAPFLIVAASINSPISSGTAGLADHRHAIETTYNFE